MILLSSPSYSPLRISGSLTLCSLRADSAYRYTGRSNISDTASAYLSDRDIQVSIVAPSSGIKGTTSTAPILACSPRCVLISINSIATAVLVTAASSTDSGGPTIVTTVRLKSWPMSTSKIETPSTEFMESVIASIMVRSLPSL